LKDELKQEAIKRLEILKLDSKVIKEFKEKDKVYVSKLENTATEVILDEGIMNLIKMFEDKKTIKIYHVVIFDKQMYMFAIHTHEEIWQKEKADLKRGWVTVVSCDTPTKGVIVFVSKDIRIETDEGKIKRVVIWTTKSEN